MVGGGLGAGVVGALDVGGAHPGGEAGFEGVAADAVVGLAEDVEAVAGVLQVGAEGGGVHRETRGVVPGFDTVDVLAAPVAGARGGALGGVAVGVAEGSAPGGEAVHVGGVGGGVAEVAHDAAVHAVGHEEDDVGVGHRGVVGDSWLVIRGDCCIWGRGSEWFRVRRKRQRGWLGC